MKMSAMPPRARVLSATRAPSWSSSQRPACRDCAGNGGGSGWRREKNPKLTFSGCFCANPRIPAKRIGDGIVAFSPGGVALTWLQDRHLAVQRCHEKHLSNIRDTE